MIFQHQAAVPVVAQQLVGTRDTWHGELAEELEFVFEHEAAFDDPIEGVATAKAMPGSNALLSGTARWYLTFRADGTPVFDGTVGLPEDEPNLALDKVNLEQGALVTIQDFTYVSPTVEPQRT